MMSADNEDILTTTVIKLWLDTTDFTQESFELHSWEFKINRIVYNIS